MTRDLTKNSEESEKALESYLVSKVKGMRGMCLKYSNLNTTGYPDRLILMRGLQDIWVELKSKGCSPTHLQQVRIHALRDMGRLVYVCDSKQAIDTVIRDIQSLLNGGGLSSNQKRHMPHDIKKGKVYPTQLSEESD